MNAKIISITIANGIVVVPLPEGPNGNVEISLSTFHPPSAGTLKIEALAYGESAYSTIGGASAIPLASLSSGPILATDFGQFIGLRFTMSGVVGGGGVLSGTASVFSGLPAGIADGTRAILTQSFDEANAKRGLLFYFRKHIAAVANGTPYNIVFNTGADPVLIHERSMYTEGVNVSVQLFKAPTGVSGGTPIVIQNYDDNNPVATECSVTGGASVTTTGTSWGDPEYIYNASANGNGQRSGSGLSPAMTRVLAPNKSYLIQIVNNVSGSIIADYFLTWSEGAIDLPRQ